MPKLSRLSGAEIRRLKPEKRLNTALFSLSYSRVDGRAKAACTVSKKTAAKASDRNLLKRRMREALRAARPLPDNAGMVLIAKRAAVEATYDAIRQDVAELMVKLRSARSL